MSTFRRSIWIQAVMLSLAVASESGAQNAVVGWHAVTESTVAGSGRKNAVALPYYAYVDVAMYDAVTAIDRHFQPFAVRVYAPRGASRTRPRPAPRMTCWCTISPPRRQRSMPPWRAL